MAATDNQIKRFKQELERYDVTSETIGKILYENVLFAFDDYMRNDGLYSITFQVGGNYGVVNISANNAKDAIDIYSKNPEHKGLEIIKIQRLEPKHIL